MRKENCRTFLRPLRFSVEVDGPSALLKSPAIYLFSSMDLSTFCVSVTAEVVSSSSSYSENKEGCWV